MPVDFTIGIGVKLRKELGRRLREGVEIGDTAAGMLKNTPQFLIP